ncbi:MAG: bifunctional DNA-binding transcriptional regulator/O6-methylguanine-DNA methyltransferase Ada [Nitrospirota bacterium]
MTSSATVTQRGDWAGESDRCWAAILARDPAADGTFYYSVRTTGVYCRPSCAARQPLRENVRFHATGVDAEQAGFRPCKRCRPEQPSSVDRQAAMVVAICRYIEQAEHLPSLDELAQRANMSPSHFHRVFTSVTGLTPRGYVTAQRATRVRVELRRDRPVTDALYQAGFNSSGRFYEATNALLGMTPSRYRTGGAHTDIRFAVGACTLGAILVAQSERGVCAILLGDDPDALTRDLQDRFPRANLIGGDAAFEGLVSTVVGLVEAPGRGLNLPLDIRGTAFQQRVWQALQGIPVGSTVTYTDIANRIGLPKSVRAVGQACGANPLAVAIPCHRVVRQDGGLSGYRWGIERKRTLLERESSVAP